LCLSRGECINIDEYDNLANYFGLQFSRKLIIYSIRGKVKFFYSFVNLLSYIFSYYYLITSIDCNKLCNDRNVNNTNYTNKTINFSNNTTNCMKECILNNNSDYKQYLLFISFILWIFLFVQNILLSNKHILHRIWKKSMMPYLQLYVSFVETWAFCDLVNWDIRILIVIPSLFLNQIIVINNDSIYFKQRRNNY
jgi:hypothetical protein